MPEGHHDPDLFTKVLAGQCHSPTLSQFGRSLILQIVSNKWTMHRHIKGAFLENVREKAPAGVRVEGSLVQVRNRKMEQMMHQFDTSSSGIASSRRHLQDL